jgi:very-short-patch-repair endonuclease
MSKKDPSEEKDSPKIFLRALKKMLKEKMPAIRTYHEFGTIIEQNSRKGICKVHKNTVNEFLNKGKDPQISTLEKILLNDAVSDEALSFFIEEFIKLLKYHRSYSYEDEKTVYENAYLEDAEYDAERDRVLSARGLRLLRIKNEEVRQNLNSVLMRIATGCCEET